MEVCDYVHKSTDGSLSGSPREGPICATKKVIVSCQRCPFETGCSTASGNSWVSCDTQHAAAAAQSG
jgi:hypothetical protein